MNLEWLGHRSTTKGRGIDYGAYNDLSGLMFEVIRTETRAWVFVVQNNMGELHVSKNYPSARAAKAAAGLWLETREAK